MNKIKQKDLVLKSGVYMITNIVNNKKYIGSSIDIYTRLRTHLSKFRNKKHNNIYFQRSFDKYGEDYFKAEVLEYCSKNVLRSKEYDWMQKLKPEYNLQENPKEYGFTDEQKKMISDSLKRRYKAGEIKAFNHPDSMIPIRVYDEYYRLINIFESTSEACREMKHFNKSSFHLLLKNKIPYYKNRYIIIPDSIEDELEYIKEYFNKPLNYAPILKIGTGVLTKSTNGEFGMAKRRLNKDPFSIIKMDNLGEYCFMGFNKQTNY